MTPRAVAALLIATLPLALAAQTRDAEVDRRGHALRRGAAQSRSGDEDRDPDLESAERRHGRHRQADSRSRARAPSPICCGSWPASTSAGIRWCRRSTSAASARTRFRIASCCSSTARRTTPATPADCRSAPRSIFSRCRTSSAIEVVRGPGSSLYGENAYWGVINIVTLSGDDLAGGDVQLYGGSRTTGEVSAQFGQRFSRGSILGAVRFLRTMFPQEFWIDDRSKFQASDIFLKASLGDWQVSGYRHDDRLDGFDEDVSAGRRTAADRGVPIRACAEADHRRGERSSTTTRRRMRRSRIRPTSRGRIASACTAPVATPRRSGRSSRSRPITATRPSAISASDCT